jgi:hypothetical protein
MMVHGMGGKNKKSPDGTAANQIWWFSPTPLLVHRPVQFYAKSFL